MKKIVLSALSAVALSTVAFAGQPMVSSGKDFKPMVEPPCIADTEFQLDVFASYTDSRSGSYSDGFGGGLALNYFFTRYIGVGVEGNLYDGDANGVWAVSGRVLARYPIDCLAPYVFVAGGVQADGETVGTIGTGGGLEYRVSPKLGIFGEGRYTWAENDGNNVQVRLGVRVVF